MPKYIFLCPKCEATTHKYVSVSTEHIKCSCGEDMNRQLPNINGEIEVREVVDPYTNRKWGKDHETIIKDRKAKHFRDVEIPRLIEKYSIETCLENKWLVYNDKGELVINKDWTPSN